MVEGYVIWELIRVGISFCGYVDDVYYGWVDEVVKRDGVEGEVCVCVVYVVWCLIVEKF